MAEQQSNVLLISDDPAQSQHLLEDLQEAGVPVQTCSDRDAVKSALIPAARNLVIYGAADISSQAVQQARDLKEAVADVPVLVHMTTFREVTRLRFLEVGADDLVPDEAVTRTASEMLAVRATVSSATAGPVNAGHAGEMYFRLKEDELSNALQFLCMTGRTGLLHLEFPDGESGEIYLAENTIVYASTRDIVGMKAIAQMIGRSESEAHFFDGREPPEVVNQRPISQVLIEAAVMADEIRAGSSGRGPTSSV